MNREAFILALMLVPIFFFVMTRHYSSEKTALEQTPLLAEQTLESEAILIEPAVSDPQNSAEIEMVEADLQAASENAVAVVELAAAEMAETQIEPEGVGADLTQLSNAEEMLSEESAEQVSSEITGAIVEEFEPDIRDVEEDVFMEEDLSTYEATLEPVDEYWLHDDKDLNTEEDTP